MDPVPAKRTTWGLLLILALIWGSSFILMKRGLFHEGQAVLSPWQVATTRLAIAWLVLSPLLFRHVSLLREQWLPLLGSGLLGNGIPAVLFATAQTRVDSAVSGMLNSLTPLMTLATGVLLFGTTVRWAHLLGIGLGFVGAAGLVLARGEGTPHQWTLYALLPVLGTVGYGLSGNIVKRHLHHLPPEATSVLALTWVGPPCLYLSLSSGLPAVLSTHPHGWSALGHVAMLAVLSSALALVLWNELLRRTSALRASSVTYLMPVVAIGWGLLDGESIQPAQLIMIALVLGGVYLVSRSDR